MVKVDFKKEFSQLYNPKKGIFSQVKVPKLKYFMIDGKGDPNTSKEYIAAIQVLYSLSYTLKFMSKRELDKDYAVAIAKEKKSELDFCNVRVQPLTEGQSEQIMYEGAYKDEGPVIMTLHKEYLPQNKLVPNGKHHEIYLGHPRKTDPSKLKTIIRQPVKKG